jgi:hypothetical protein
MSAKNAPAKKVNAATKPKITEPVVVVAPVPEPVVVVAPVVDAAKAAASKKRTAAAKAPVKEDVAVVTPVVESTPAAETAAASSDAESARPKLRAYNDIFAEITASINEAYNLLQAAKRSLKSLQSAHNREVHNNTKTRECATRTPTIVFDQQLVDYFRKRLPANLLAVNRKGEHVDLSTLNTETRVHRTDVTQLYTAVFKHHKMQDPEDRRKVLYSQDKELVELLTSGSAPVIAEDIKKIKDGSYKLTIFNIQRFTNHHLGKVDLPEPVAVATA